MFEFTALVRTVDRVRVQCHPIARFVNIGSCGLMIGAAMSDPISAAESHRYCEIILPLFAISSLLWLTLNLRAFMEVGLITVPLGLVILMLVATQVGPAFVAWLPLYAATVGIVTTALAHVLKQSLQALQYPHEDDENDTSNTQSATRQRRDDRQITPMARWMSEPLSRYMLGQGSQHPSHSESSASTLSLSSTGRARSSWGSVIHDFWYNPMCIFPGRILSNGPNIDHFDDEYTREFERYRRGSPDSFTDVGSRTNLLPYEDI